MNVDRVQVLQIYEKLLGADTLEMGPIDYSFKPTKPNVSFEQPLLRQALSVTTAPVYYGSMPNLPLYNQPDGPFPNPMELLPAGKITEARESYEGAISQSVKDMVYVCSAMHECGADAIILDTVGAAGDPDFLAALMATEQLKAKYPEICIELAMAGEFVLGMHGELDYQGERLAGMYAHDQVRMAQKAGATIFGPVCNTRTNKTAPWNTSYAITYTKACCDIADIPIHVNMGMGVGAMHAMASGMGGMRAAGDRVARMQISRGMRIDAAKQYVAQKLKVAVEDLTDPIRMSEVREDLGLGLLHPRANYPKCMEAKFNIARILDIDINCVERFKKIVAI